MKTRIKDNDFTKLNEISQGEYVQTLDGRKSMLDLIHNVGVEKKLLFYKDIEIDTKSASSNRFFTKQTCVAKGLRFNDGFEILGVDTKLYRLLDVDEERIKKRSAWKKK